jgi:hypothetical protein
MGFSWIHGTQGFAQGLSMAFPLLRRLLLPQVRLLLRRLLLALLLLVSVALSLPLLLVVHQTVFEMLLFEQRLVVPG